MLWILYLFRFLLTVGGSLSVEIEVGESENVTLEYPTICLRLDVSIVNKNNVTVATWNNNYFSINQAIFSERYSLESYNKINIANISITDAGTYSCINRTHFIPGSSRNLLVFRKPDQPKISWEPQFPVLYEKVTLNCIGSSRSAPAEYFQKQSMEHQWFEDGDVKFTGDQYTFILSENLRNKSISCTVQDSGGFGNQSDTSKPLILLPKAAATLKYIDPGSESGIYKVLGGSSVTLECIESRTGTPKISEYSWTRNGVPLSEHGKTLVFAQVNSNQSADYACQAENSEGLSNTVKMTLQVLEGPELTSVKQIATSGDGRVKLTCSSSVNAQDIVWFESGSTEILHVGATFNTYVTKSTNFTCQVSTILNPTDGSPVIRGANSTISVLYKYPPVRKTHRLQQKITYNRHTGHQFEESIEYESYPDVISASLKTSTGTQTKLNVKVIHNTVEIYTGHLTKEDCTSFKLIVQNTEGSDSIDIHIHCYPHAPIELTASLSVNQVTLKWSPGFDGGTVQNFKVLQSLDGKSWKRYYSTHNKEVDTGLIETVVGSISPDKIYLFKVYADNGLSSDDSNIAFTYPSKEKVSESSAVIAGSICGMVIFVVIAIGIYIFYRYHYIPAHRSKTAGKKREKGQTVQESDYERPVLRPTPAGNNLTDYENLQKCQYVNMNYDNRSDHISGIHSNNHYENIKQHKKPGVKPNIMPKPKV